MLAFQPSNCPLLTSFSVHFLLSAACERWRHSPGSISPGWTLERTHRRRPHSVSSPYPGKSPLPVFRSVARPPSGTTYNRPRKKSSAGRYRRRHRQGRYNSHHHNDSTPAGSGRLPVFSVPVSCGRGSRPVCALKAAAVCMGYLSCAPPFLFCRSPRKGFPALARSPHFGTSCPEAGSLRCFPSRGIPFRTVILFSRCGSSMNYPKSTRKKCNPRIFARIAFL